MRSRPARSRGSEAGDCAALTSSSAYGVLVMRVRLLLLLIGLAAISGCASLPVLEPRTASSALADTADTSLGRAVAPRVAAHPGKSGIYALDRPLDAFAARGALAAAAERSIDAQYYIWHGDTTGELLFAALLDAAERGVRVRLLLDDANTKGLDATLAGLDSHPNVEVRLFNPFPNRGARVVDFLTDFGRTNRRMHNKSFTVDNQATIVGGRNIGNEYFGAETDVLFADLDVLAIGPVVAEVSRVFDAYWSSASAYPAAKLLPAVAPGEGTALRERWAKLRAAPEAASYVRALRETRLAGELLERRLVFEWATANVVADEPSKVLTDPERMETHLLPRLEKTLGKPARELDLVSPYFVPAENGTAAFRAVAARGVKIRILTNSLAATDVGAVHAGYAKRRVALLEGGVLLYELKPKGERADEGAKGIGSSSDASLHAKTFAVDRQRIFVGSFNLDPRSARLNTEMGIVIESPALAARLAQAFDEAIPGAAYRVELGADGRSLVWIERTAGGEVRHDTEPGVGALRLFGVRVMSVLPIEWLL